MSEKLLSVVAAEKNRYGTRSEALPGIELLEPMSQSNGLPVPSNRPDLAFTGHDENAAMDCSRKK
jgi:hypothetical protein